MVGEISTFGQERMLLIVGFGFESKLSLIGTAGVPAIERVVCDGKLDLCVKLFYHQNAIKFGDKKVVCLLLQYTLVDLG
jgi:hypothetical protein